MENIDEQIKKESNIVIEKALALESMMSSKGWQIFLETVAKRKQAIVDKSFKSEYTVKQHEYGRGFVVETEKIISELKGRISEAAQARENIDNL